MTTTGTNDDWARLASYVNERMKAEKIYSTAELQRRSGLSLPTVRAVRAGKLRPGTTTMQAESLSKLDDGLRWAPDSSAAVLAGGEPTDAAPSAGGVSQSDVLSPGQVARVHVVATTIEALDRRVAALEEALIEVRGRLDATDGRSQTSGA